MPETRERSALDPRDRLAVMVSMAGSYIESGRGDDALAVMRTVAEDVAAEIARELEEAREEVAEWVQAAIEHAADLLAERRHGESAPDALMAIRHEVAEWVEAEMGKLATPASDGTTRWYCEYGCGCVLDSRSARYHDCRTPSGEGEAEPDAYMVTASRYSGGGVEWVRDWLFRGPAECEEHVRWLHRPQSRWQDVRVTPLYAARRGEGGGE